MSNLYAHETYINRTKGHGIGESDWFETFADSPGVLYRAMVREYGRCIGRMYRESEQGDTRVGWVFLKRMRYEDARGNAPEDFYLREVWVEVSRTMPERYVELRNVESPWQSAEIAG